MVHYDSKYHQLLTPLCANCPDAYFQNKHHNLFQVGCCSYSPVFSLFEIYKMVLQHDSDFFIQHIYENPHNTINPYEIIIHAQVHEAFHEALQAKADDSISEADLRQEFSICRFFVSGKGCGLPPQYKTSVCRGFICSAVEESLEPEEKLRLQSRMKQIYTEASQFNHIHQEVLMKRGWNLQAHMEKVLHYFSMMEPRTLE